MNSFFLKLSKRERFLAVLAAWVVIFTLILIGIGFYSDYRDGLDLRIRSLEQEIVNLHIQDTQRDAVAAAFRAVAEERSTDLSVAEIHDLLRREIFRLALRNPEATNVEDKQLNRSDYLVWIPSLREGALSEAGEDYREYQIRIRIPATTIAPLLEFLARIQTSPQLLRIDTLEITRSPHSTSVAAYLEVTRTVINAHSAAGDA